MSNIIAITHYLSEVLYAKDISTLPSVFKSDHIFYTKIIEFFNQEDSLSEFVNELLNSCIYHITNEKLLEHFPNGASGTVSTNRNHENCISCIAGTGFILNYSLISGAADPLNSSKAGYQIIYHGSFKDSWLIWLSSCGTLRNSREGVFNLNDSSAFYCSYIFKTALDFAFKYNKSNPGVVISFWLDEKIYSDPLYVYLKTRIGIDGTSEWGEAVKSFRKNDETRIVDLNLNGISSLHGAICSNPGPVVRNGVEPSYIDTIGDQICFKDQMLFKKYVTLRSIQFFEHPH